MFIASYPSIEDSDQQEKKAARAASGEIYVRVFVLFLRRALVEGVYGGGESGGFGWGVGGKVAGVVKRWEDWVQEEHEQGNTLFFRCQSLTDFISFFDRVACWPNIPRILSLDPWTLYSRAHLHGKQITA